MSPVIRVGPRCHRCHKRPVWTDALCNPCWCLVAVFGHRPVDATPSPDRLQPVLEILDADSLEFERRLAAWLAGNGSLPPDSSDSWGSP